MVNAETAVFQDAERAFVDRVGTPLMRGFSDTHPSRFAIASADSL